MLFLFAALALPAAADVAVVEAFFEDYDRAVIRELNLPAGDTLYLRFSIAGFRPDPKSQVRLAYSIDCLDPRKVPLAETFTEKIEQALSPQDEKWRPRITWSLPVPPYAPGGEYTVTIRVRDEIARKEAQHEMKFQVRGETIEPGVPLGVANFEFADTEDGPAKPAPAFSPGNPLWARFRLVGFQITPDKQVSVEQDVAVLDSTGKALFSKPQAMVESGSRFYPPRYLTASFNLDLQSKLKPGEYTIRLDIRDLAARKDARFEIKFNVVP